MLELKTAQFAEVYIIGEEFNTPPEQNLSGNNVVPSTPDAAPNKIVKVKVGIAQNLRINSSFGSNNVNVIGTPLPILVPGYFQAEISMDKATLDDKAFSSLANINPLTAYLPNSYDFENGSLNFDDDTAGHAPLTDLTTDISFQSSPAEWRNKIPRFVFALAVFDKIQDAYSRPTGIYIAMLRTVGQTLSANDAVIIQGITAVAKPVVGGWSAIATEVYNNSPFFGYSTRTRAHRI